MTIAQPPVKASKNFSDRVHARSLFGYLLGQLLVAHLGLDLVFFSALRALMWPAQLTVLDPHEILSSGDRSAAEHFDRNSLLLETLPQPEELVTDLVAVELAERKAAIACSRVPQERVKDRCELDARVSVFAAGRLQ